MSHLIDCVGFNHTSTLVGHFVSSPREREKSHRRNSRNEREGQGRKRNRDESEETEEKNSHCEASTEYQEHFFSRWQIDVIFLFFRENRIWQFMQIVSLGDNLHELSIPVFSEK